MLSHEPQEQFQQSKRKYVIFGPAVVDDHNKPSEALLNKKECEHRLASFELMHFHYLQSPQNHPWARDIHILLASCAALKCMLSNPLHAVQFFLNVVNPPPQTKKRKALAPPPADEEDAKVPYAWDCVVRHLSVDQQEMFHILVGRVLSGAKLDNWECALVLTGPSASTVLSALADLIGEEGVWYDRPHKFSNVENRNKVLLSDNVDKPTMLANIEHHHCAVVVLDPAYQNLVFPRPCIFFELHDCDLEELKKDWERARIDMLGQYATAALMYGKTHVPQYDGFWIQKNKE